MFSMITNEKQLLFYTTEDNIVVMHLFFIDNEQLLLTFNDFPGLPPKFPPLPTIFPKSPPQFHVFNVVWSSIAPFPWKLDFRISFIFRF